MSERVVVEDSAGKCVDREQTESSCNDRDLHCDSHTEHALNRGSKLGPRGSICDPL